MQKKLTKLTCRIGDVLSLALAVELQHKCMPSTLKHTKGKQTCICEVSLLCLATSYSSLLPLSQDWSADLFDHMLQWLRMPSSNEQQ